MRRGGKGRKLNETFDQQLLEFIYDARVIPLQWLFHVFPHVPKVTIYKHIQAFKQPEYNYVQTVKYVTDPRIASHFHAFGRRSDLLAPGPATARLLEGREESYEGPKKYPIKNNNFKTGYPEPHLLMGSQYVATLHAAKNLGMVTLTDVKREPKEIRLEVRNDGNKYPLEPDWKYILDGQFYYHESETGTVPLVRYRPQGGLSYKDKVKLEESSWMAKLIKYTALHNDYVKRGKHPPFLVTVVCLDLEHMNSLRRVALEYRPTLNIYRFTLFKYVKPDHPELILEKNPPENQKYWFNIQDGKARTLFDKTPGNKTPT